MAKQIFMPPSSLFSINLHRTKGFVITHSVSWEKLLTTAAKKRCTNNLGEGGGWRRGGGTRQTGEESWFIVASPLFDLVISGSCEEAAEELGLEMGHGGRVRRDT